MDVEAHHVWTPEPLPCLLQLFGGGRAFAIDILALSAHLPRLRAVLEAPGILKLMHNAGNDIAWLQSLGLFPANVLDTHELAQVSAVDPARRAGGHWH